MMKNSILSFKGPLWGLRQFLTNECPLKMTKNVFYFMLESLFILEISTSLSWLFDYVEKRLHKKVKINSKIYDVTDRQQTITIHILLNISKSKDNQTMKFLQLIEFKVKNILFQKLWRKWGRETNSRPLFIF